MDIAITKMSSKGQIVIPAELRKGIKEGEKLVVIKRGDQFILKRAKKMGKNFEEDLEFAKRTEKAWKEYKKGRFIEMDFEEFMKEVDKW